MTFVEKPEAASLQSSGEHRLVRISMPGRIGDRTLPQCRLIDMRAELQAGHRSPISRQLRAGIEESLRHDRKVMLLLNRRGFSTFVLCRSCGYELRCPKCAVSLTLHRDQTVRCHYCAHRTPLPQICPRCQSVAFRHFGAGIQMLEKALAEYFPHTELIRMDRDTTQRRGSHADHLQRFASAKRAILLGTQMIAHGHDFPAVGLVGIVAADTALSMPDFRASERTFELVTQMVGRGGRDDTPALGLIQTYQPEHPALVFGAQQSYQAFYDQELPVRRELKYPPYWRLVRILITGSKEHWVQKTALDTFERLGTQVEKQLRGEVLGPSPAAISRLQDKFRWQLLLKLPLGGTPGRWVEDQLKGQLRVQDFEVGVDWDPVSML
jgi:primosomal protein N' (replication factor Y)